jgi:hypothetical protein
MTSRPPNTVAWGIWKFVSQLLIAPGLAGGSVPLFHTLEAQVFFHFILPPSPDYIWSARPSWVTVIGERRE